MKQLHHNHQQQQELMLLNDEARRRLQQQEQARLSFHQRTALWGAVDPVEQSLFEKYLMSGNNMNREQFVSHATAAAAADDIMRSSSPPRRISNVNIENPSSSSAHHPRGTPPGEKKYGGGSGGRVDGKKGRPQHSHPRHRLPLPNRRKRALASSLEKMVDDDDVGDVATVAVAVKKKEENRTKKQKKCPSSVNENGDVGEDYEQGSTVAVAVATTTVDDHPRESSSSSSTKKKDDVFLATAAVVLLERMTGNAATNSAAGGAISSSQHRHALNSINADQITSSHHAIQYPFVENLARVQQLPYYYSDTSSPMILQQQPSGRLTSPPSVADNFSHVDHRLQGSSIGSGGVAAVVMTAPPAPGWLPRSDGCSSNSFRALISQLAAGQSSPIQGGGQHHLYPHHSSSSAHHLHPTAFGHALVGGRVCTEPSSTSQAAAMALSSLSSSSFTRTDQSANPASTMSELINMAIAAASSRNGNHLSVNNDDIVEVWKQITGTSRR